MREAIRAARLLNKHGAGIEIAHGQAEDGTPWCGLVSRDGDSLVHFEGDGYDHDALQEDLRRGAVAA